LQAASDLQKFQLRVELWTQCGVPADLPSGQAPRLLRMASVILPKAEGFGEGNFIGDPSPWEKSGGFFLLFAAKNGRAFALDHGAIDGYLSEVIPAWGVIHDIQHDFFDQGPKRTRSGALSQRL